MIAQTTHLWSALLLPALVAPWIVATALVWHGSGKGSVPVSLADAARRRLWPA